MNTMIEQLFGSKTRVKLLQLFMSSPNRSFYVREITRKIDEQINSVRRELSNLLSIGIITSDTNNNRLYYEVNQDYEYYNPLAGMFGGVDPSVLAEQPTKKTLSKVTAQDDEQVTEKPMKLKPKPQIDSEQGTVLQKAIHKLGHVSYAIFTGQFTRDTNSPVDILLVGEFNQNKVNKFIADLEAQENKELRYALLSQKDFIYRKQIRDRFLIGAIEAKKQVIIDREISEEA
jgi:hypothetical protein